VHRAFVRSDPAQLTVAREAAPEAAHVLANPVEIEADDELSQRLDGGTADFIATSDGEREPVPFEPRPVRLEDHVRRGIIRMGIHRIRPVERARGGEAHVENAHVADAGHVHQPPSIT
jgi:hypothetical protein